MEKIKQLYKKYEEIINYLIVGVMTTVVAWGAKFIGTFWLDSTDAFQNFILSTINWTAGVIFGYFANRIFVFKSKEKNMFFEFIKFAGGRVLTYFLDVFVMQAFTVWIIIPSWFEALISGVVENADTRITIWYWIATLFSAVLVTIANYVLSKLLVFRKNKKGDREEK